MYMRPCLVVEVIGSGSLGHTDADRHESRTSRTPDCAMTWRRMACGHEWGATVRGPIAWRYP